MTRTVRKTYEVSATESTEEVTEAPTEEPTSGENTETPQNPLGNKYIYQTVNVGQAGIMFNLVGEAKADSVPLNNEYRTFGIAMNIYYAEENSPETHYQEFNSNTNKQQTVSLSVTPNYPEKVIDHVAFAFVYGYNKNTMTVYNAMLNIATVGYAAAEEETTEPTTEETTESTTEEPYDDYVDYEILTETVDKSQPYMSSSTVYDAHGNYVLSQTDEAGKVTEYEYDASGNMTCFANDYYYVEYTYDAAGNVTAIENPLAESTYTYNGAGNVSAIGHNGFSYTFNYDIYNQLISTAVGNVTISSKTYNAEGVLTRTDFANGDYIEYSYDSYGNLIQVTSESGIIARFTYNKKGLVTKAEDISGGTVTYYQYDFSGSRIGEYRQAEAGALSYQLGYNSNGDKVEKTSINGQVKTITTGTDSDGNSFVDNDGVRVGSSSDDFGRTTAVTTSYNDSALFQTLYTYSNGTEANSTTNNVRSITQKRGETELLQYYYGYDSAGNINTVAETTNQNEWFEKYEYDWLNQLTKVSDKQNDTQTTFVYDDGGNITSVVKSEINHDTLRPTNEISRNTYTYGDSNWRDKLTAFNGQSITYDAMGNPLTYRDGLSFTWENGRQLKTVTNNGTTITMRYDSNGMRTHKGGVRYYYDSDNNLIATVKGSNTLFFYYDESGNATSFSHNGTMYFYVRNLQGDIINIVDSNGTVLVRYDYDVFGKITSIKNAGGVAITDTTNLAFLNPLRYRGYVYDDETGLYYLQSRYYDPVTGRFLNADIYIDTGLDSPLSTNMFAYCENNILDRTDLNGTAAALVQSTSSVMWGIGHSSILIQESKDCWWYFYWSGESVQFIFLPASDLYQLNERIKRTLKVLSVLNGINVKRTDYYNRSMTFRGDFTLSLKYIRNKIEVVRRTSDVDYYELAFNPRINKSDYDAMIKNSNTIKAALGTSTHRYHLGKQRPFSIFLIGKNSKYKLSSYNCMHVSLEMLGYGTLSNKKIPLHL